MVEEPGFLAIDVTAPPVDNALVPATQPQLALFDSTCTDMAPGVDPIHETPGGLIVRVHEAGAVYVAVSTSGTATSLGRFTMHTTFGVVPSVPDTINTLDTDPPARCIADVPLFGPEVITGGHFATTVRQGVWTRDVEPDDCDVLEGTFEEPGIAIIEAEGTPLLGRLFAGRTCTTDGWLAEASLHEGNTLVVPVRAGHHRLVLDPLANEPLAYTLAVKHVSLCHGTRDDHADLLRCATPLEGGLSADGVIGLGVRQRDEDAFSFTVDKLGPIGVRVETTSTVLGALFDERGVRLATHWTCDSAESCGVTTTLPAGRYGLRLWTHTDHAPTAYTVSYWIE